VKYTPAGGQIRIVLARQEGKLAIRVHDTGIGIPEKDLSRIFERFYRVDKARSRQMGGTGLGLAIAKEIALLHGGSIHAQSRINEGSVITVLLPISDFVKGQQEVNGL
jgi:two-component system sensor histidine kinase VicK